MVRRQDTDDFRHYMAFHAHKGCIYNEAANRQRRLYIPEPKDTASRAAAAAFGREALSASTLCKVFLLKWHKSGAMPPLERAAAPPKRGCIRACRQAPTPRMNGENKKPFSCGA